MKKQIARTLSLFSFCLLTMNAFGGGDFEAFRPPLLDIERLLNDEARLEAFERQFGFHPRAEVIVLEEDPVVGPPPPPPPPLPQEEDLGVFGNILQSEAARRLRAAQRVANEQQHVVAIDNRRFMDEIVARQQELEAQRAARKAREKAEAENEEDIDEDKEEQEIDNVPPRDPHMQAVFEAVRLRAAIVDQQIEEEEKRLAAEKQRLEEEQGLQKKEELTEEELEQQRLEAERIKAEKEQLAAENARLHELRKHLHEGITRRDVALKRTKLPKKRLRNRSFAGTASVRVEIDERVSSSLVIVPNYDGNTRHVDVDEDGNWDNLQPLFADIDTDDEPFMLEEKEHVDAQKDEEKKQEEEKPQAQSSSWFGGRYNPMNWWGGGAPAQANEVVEVVEVDPTSVERIWNEIAEVVQLIDIGRPQNMMDSIADVGPGIQFFQHVRSTWTGEFHRYIYYPALVRLIRERYHEATFIVAENQVAMMSDDIGQGILEPMGEALDYIEALIKHMDTWMQRYSSNIAQTVLNPRPSDFLINEFPNFTGAMTNTFLKLRAILLKKGTTHAGFNVIEVAQGHMLESMTIIDTELKAAEVKVVETQLSNNKNSLSDDGSLGQDA